MTIRRFRNKKDEGANELIAFLDKHNWIFQGYCKIDKTQKPNVLVQIGERYHLKSRNGIYTVIGFEKGISFVKLSCWRWEQLGEKPIIVHISDIKCKVGIPGKRK
jgi:hypothetical protein